MTALTHSEKLHAITTLTARSGISQVDFHDCRRWATLKGADLTQKDCERIDAIFAQFFEVKQ